MIQTTRNQVKTLLFKTLKTMNQILLPKVFQEDIKHERIYFLQLESVCLKHSSITKSTPYNISNTLAKLAMKIYLLNRQKPDRNLNHTLFKLNDLYWEEINCITRYYIVDAS